MVTAPNCHLCEAALEELAGLATEFPLSVRALEGRSVEGARIVRRLRPGLFPAVVIDGALFSVGRLPRRKLRRLLEAVA